MGFTDILIFIVVVAIILLIFAFRRSKGKRGERHMAARLNRLPKEEYRVINDLLIRSEGHSTQIDHIVVSRYGIFVIETKFYNGWILGGENSEYWTQSIYGNRYKLRNPLWQNQGHIKAVRRLLDDKGKIPFYNIVAFSAQATIKVDRSLPVMYWRQVVPYIRQVNQPVMSESAVEEIIDTLLNANVKDRKAIKQHVKSVKQNQRRRDIAVSQGKCPLCGGDLVLKNGRFGKFYGCSNFPRCRYTLNK